MANDDQAKYRTVTVDKSLLEKFLSLFQAKHGFKPVTKQVFEADLRKRIEDLEAEHD
ncbi:MAG: hypothetical protein H7A25_22405 [Leptospiraceae bacterium]|nr:hypothetical protein [Leptospiraceae bacterium]MCP5502667.1 hypothetical protein [Leptospiraceae bacterium]